MTPATVDLPRAIVDRLDELELYSDDPVRVVRLTGEVRELLACWLQDQAALIAEALP